MNISSSQQSQVDDLDLQQNKWIKIKFGDIAEEVKDRVDIPSESGYERFVGGDHLDSGDLTIKRWGSTNDVQAQKLLFKKGDILFGKRNAYLRKVAYADFDGVCSAHMMVLKPRTENVDERFFPHFMQSDQFWERALMISEGSMSPTIKWKVLEKQEFLIPSKDEQSRIAEVLWAVEDVVVKNEQFLAEAEHYKQLMMSKLFHKGIGHTDFKNVKKLGNVPKKWEIVQFSETISIVSGQVDPTQEPYNQMIHIGPENIESGTGRIISPKTNQEIKISSGNYLFSEKNLLYSKIRPYLNKVGFPKYSGTCSADMYPLKPNEDRLLPDYLFYYLLSQMFLVQAISFQNRTGMPKINRDELNSTLIPLPGLSEQKQIVVLFTTIDETITTARSTVESSKALKMKLINKLLSPVEGDEN